MLPTEREDFLRAANATRVDAFERPPLTQGQAKVWWNQLREHSLSEVVRALRHWEGTGRFAPKPSDIKRTITGREEGGVIAGNTTCQWSENGHSCQERWAVQTNGKSLCSRHFARMNGKPYEPTPRFHWQDELSCTWTIDKRGEGKAREWFSAELVDYCLANAVEMLKRLPEQRGNVPQALAA